MITKASWFVGNSQTHSDLDIPTLRKYLKKTFMDACDWNRAFENLGVHTLKIDSTYSPGSESDNQQTPSTPAEVTLNPQSQGISAQAKKARSSVLGE